MTLFCLLIMNPESFQENLFIASSVFNSKTGWAYAHQNQNFVCGKNDNNDQERAETKALLEAVRHLNPLLKSIIHTTRDHIVKQFDNIKSGKLEILTNPNLKSMDLWQEIHDKTKHRTNFIEVKYIIDGTSKQMLFAQQMARKASGIK